MWFNQDTVMPVKAHWSVSHFSKTIDSYGAQHHGQYDKQEKILHELRKEFYSTDDSPFKSNYM